MSDSVGAAAEDAASAGQTTSNDAVSAHTHRIRTGLHAWAHVRRESLSSMTVRFVIRTRPFWMQSWHPCLPSRDRPEGSLSSEAQARTKSDHLLIPRCAAATR